MSKVQEALMSDDEKRTRDLESQRRVLCPEGEFVFIHQACLDDTMMLLEKNNLTVFPGQVEEFAVGKVLDEYNIDSIGRCDCCKSEINNRNSSYYRLWVLTKEDYEKNIEYRKYYETKKNALKVKQERHEKWQNIEHKTPYLLLPFVRLIRKLAYKLRK